MLNRHNFQCTHTGIAPQALPASQPNLGSNPYHFSSFDGDRVRFFQNDRMMHTSNAIPVGGSSFERKGDNVHNPYVGMYAQNLVCKKGVGNIDNQCLCPGSGDSMPYAMQGAQMTDYVTKTLFSPFLPETIPGLTPAAQIAIKQRSPVSGQGNFYQMDQPLPCAGAGGGKLRT